MQKDSKILIILGVLLAVVLMFLGYKLGKDTPNNNKAVTTIDTVHTEVITEIPADTVIITDTLRKTKTNTIYEKVYIDNPLDTVIYYSYIKLRDSLARLNVNEILVMDTIIKKPKRTDSLTIECNKIKNSITFSLIYGLEKDTTKTKTITIKDNSFHWDDFGFGALSGFSMASILFILFR